MLLLNKAADFLAPPSLPIWIIHFGIRSAIGYVHNY